ncbi:MAG: TolC family protein [Saprospiraceae bacterium]
MIKMKKYSIRLLFILITVVNASFTMSGQSSLEQYIDTAFSRNIVIQQKKIAYSKAILAIQIAKSLYSPGVSLQSGFTTGDGGRYIDLPVGDLLNPVYSTLNQITQSNQFPQIENVKQSFLPNQLFDAHIRTAIPIINPDLKHNREIQSAQVPIRQWEMDLYKRELAKNIKVAYYNYVMASSAQGIIQNALVLLKRNIEINQSLQKNGKGLPAYVLRSQSEYEQVNAQLIAAENQVRLARNYFNLLLNKDLEDEIAIVEIPFQASVPYGLVAATNREELQIIRQSQKLVQLQTNQLKDYWKPRLNGFLDLGNQFEQWRKPGQGWYYLGGIQLEMTIFQGNKNKLKIEDNFLAEQNVALEQEQTENLFEFSQHKALLNLETQIKKYQSAQIQIKSAESYFNLIEKGYKEGIHSQIEYLDARNQLTNAQIQENILRYQVLQAQAELERESATFNLPN